MMSFDLRHYQQHAKQEVRFALAGGCRRVVLYLPTGGGKTLTAVSIIQNAVAKGRKVVFLANRKQLIYQTSAVLSRYGIDHGVIQAENTCRLDARVLVAQPIEEFFVRGGVVRGRDLVAWIPEQPCVDDASLSHVPRL